MAHEAALVPVAVGQREQPLPRPQVALVLALVLLARGSDVDARAVQLALDELARVRGAIGPALQPGSGHLSAHKAALVGGAIRHREQALAVHHALHPFAIVLEVRIGCEQARRVSSAARSRRPVEVGIRGGGGAPKE